LALRPPCNGQSRRRTRPLSEGRRARPRRRRRSSRRRTQPEQAKQDAAEDKKRALAEAAKAYKAAKSAVELARMEKELRARELLVLEKKKEKLQTAYAECVKPLVEGIDDESKAQELIEALRAALEGLGFDTSILVALPTAFGKAPAARGSFDAMVISNLTEEINMRIAGFEATLREAESVVVADNAAIAAAEAALAEAQQKQLGGANTFAEFQRAQQKAESDLADLKQILKALEPELRTFSKDQAKAQKRLSSFREGALAAFLSLRDRVTRPPLPPPAEEDDVQEWVVVEPAEAVAA